MKATMKPKFSLGQIVATPGALEALRNAGQTASFFLDQHVIGNWGTVGRADWIRNDEALRVGERLLSAYTTLKKREDLDYHRSRPFTRPAFSCQKNTEAGQPAGPA